MSTSRRILRDIDLDPHFLSRRVGLSRESGLFQLDLLDGLHFGGQTIAIQPDGPNPLQIFSAQPEFQGGARVTAHGCHGKQFRISFPILRGFLGPKHPGGQHQHQREQPSDPPHADLLVTREEQSNGLRPRQNENPHSRLSENPGLTPRGNLLELGSRKGTGGRRGAERGDRRTLTGTDATLRLPDPG